MKRQRTLFALILIFVFSAIIYSQVIPFNSDRWEITGRINKQEKFMGKESLFLQGGIAFIKDSNFKNGIIEYDVNFEKRRGFNGAIWRMQDLENYEEFYMRAHQSGNPDANQYTPVFNGLAGWQLYYGDGHGAAVKYKFNKWMHVKIIVSGKRGEIYIDDMKKPVLVINEMKRELKAGKVGIKVNNFAPAHIADFSFKNIDKPELKSKLKTLFPIPAGTVRKWSISKSFNNKVLNYIVKLEKRIKMNTNWTIMDSENSGTVNLARVNKLTKVNNTVFAKVIVFAKKAITKKISFGYSDFVKVYLNDRLLYSGNNFYRSRDYRYLGTIGYFDDLYLSLKKGKNEVWFAVSESFGGWGIKAKFEDLNGIRLN